MTYKMAILKRNIELLLMFPFVLAGKIAGRLMRLNTTHKVFFFVRNADIGGSTNVNIDILHCISHLQPLVILTKKPLNNQFIERFQIPGVRVIDWSPYLDKKWLYFVNFLGRGVLAAWINRAPDPVIFGGECIFFYKMLPHVKPETKTVELCHLTTWFEYSRAFIKYLDVRIFSTPNVKRDMEAIYRRDQVPAPYFERLFFTDNRIDIPDRVISSGPNDALQVLFVGRGAPQKRVHLIAEIARQTHEMGLPVHVSFVGDVDAVIPDAVKPLCTLYGNVNSRQQLEELYNRSDVLILTSAYEGLPLVVMDMMVRGKVVLSTAVDGIPDYVQHLHNGLLVYAKEEAAIVTEAIGLLKLLTEEPAMLQQMGSAARKLAEIRFNGETFCNTYNQYFTNDKAAVA